MKQITLSPAGNRTPSIRRRRGIVFSDDIGCEWERDGLEGLEPRGEAGRGCCVHWRRAGCVTALKGIVDTEGRERGGESEREELRKGFEERFEEVASAQVTRLTVQGEEENQRQDAMKDGN
ncbi:hypothetical protein BDQ17DRAFT_1335972 [Cyathus striatus]|nr:hypothetical protein BDQ17DRAFT_1335972 [Cyathus striatus]